MIAGAEATIPRVGASLSACRPSLAVAKLPPSVAARIVVPSASRANDACSHESTRDAPASLAIHPAMAAGQCNRTPATVASTQHDAPPSSERSRVWSRNDSTFDCLLESAVTCKIRKGALLVARSPTPNPASALLTELAIACRGFGKARLDVRPEPGRWEGTTSRGTPPRRGTTYRGLRRVLSTGVKGKVSNPLATL